MSKLLQLNLVKVLTYAFSSVKINTNLNLVFLIENYQTVEVEKRRG
jgi:hypothetical protein